MASTEKADLLDSLIIRNFRSLQNFKVEKLGRVNLIVGRNNSGKSSVLEALRIYAGKAQRSLLKTLATEHDEPYAIDAGNSADMDAALPFQDFFTGRAFPDDDETAIEIGSANHGEKLLRIRHAFFAEKEETVIDRERTISTLVKHVPVSKSDVAADLEGVRQALVVTKGTQPLQTLFLDPSTGGRRPLLDLTKPYPVGVVPPQLVPQDELANEWDRIALTEHEHFVREALRIVAPDFANLTFVRSGNSDLQPGMRLRRSARVKLDTYSRPVPLNSMGDGMLRVLQLVLKTFPARDGFLLIDELENGLHFSVQEQVWRLLFEMAYRFNIQVFATTHSWDCIESFAKIARERTDIEGVLFRMGRSARSSERGKVIATVFDEESLYDITQRDVEVR